MLASRGIKDLDRSAHCGRVATEPCLAREAPFASPGGHCYHRWFPVELPGCCAELLVRLQMDVGAVLPLTTQPSAPHN